MPFTISLDDKQYADQQSLQDHVNLLLSQPPPSSDSLTNPLGTQHDTQDAGPEPTPSPSLAPESAPPVDNPSQPAAPASSLPAPDAPVTVPLQTPNQGAMLDRNGVIAYVQQHAADYGLDPAAVLAVANHEGLNTAPGSHWTLPGEGNISFGPPSWYGNGAGSALIAQHGQNAAAWSWTPPGIDYWLGQVAQAAKGLTGNAAISAIVHGFERPREDLAPGEVRNAQADYATFQKPGSADLTYASSSPTPDLSTSGGPSLVAGTGAPQPTSPTIASGSPTDTSSGSGVSSPAQQLADHAIALLGGGLTAIGDTANGAIQTLGGAKDQLAQHVSDMTGGQITVPDLTKMTQEPAGQPAASQPMPSDLLTNPLGTGNAPAQSAPVTPAPTPAPQTGPFDFVKQKFSDAIDALGSMLGNAYAGNEAQGEAERQYLMQTASNPDTRNAAISGMLPSNPLSLAGGAGLGAPTEGEQLSAQRNQAIAENNPLRDVPVVGGASTFAAQAALDPTNLALAGAGGAKVVTSPEVQTAIGAALRSRMPAEAEAGFASGADALANLLQRVKAYPDYVQQGLEDFVTQQAKSGKEPAEIGDAVIQWMHENPPPPTTPPPAPSPTSALPNAPRARAAAADKAFGGSRDARLAANDVYQGAEPPVDASQQFTRTPQGDIVPIQPQGADVALQGLINEAKARGLDTSSLEAQLGQKPEPLPPVRYDPTTDEWVETATGNRTAAGVFSGGPPEQPPSRPTSTGSPAPEPQPAAALPESIPPKAGITPETVQIAHERIDKALGAGVQAEAAHQQLDEMLQTGADPGAIARFLGGVVEGRKVSIPSIIRTVRTGSMAGGLSTEAKVAVSPVVQVAMRAPVGAVNALLRGRPGDITAGLQGGLSGLAEGAAEALQTLRYGINYRSALVGTAKNAELLGGGYGFAPGVDVMGANRLQRGLGTAAVGLVRTHGAIADISAAIGRRAALATGASPAQATEAGQQWALRSGKYGTIGQLVANKLEGLRSDNPAMDVLGQILVPFFRVGYNATTQGLERSPLGLAGTGIDALRAAAGNPRDGANLSGQLANNMFGVGLAGLGYAMAANGDITGEHPSGGAPKWSVRVAGQWVPLRFLGPAQEALAQSATLHEAIRDGRGNIGQIAQRSAEQYAGHVYDESWLRSIADVFSGVSAAAHLASGSAAAQRQNASELAYQAKNLGESFVPQFSLGRQTAGKAQDVMSAFQAPTRSAPTRAPASTVPGTRYQSR